MILINLSHPLTEAQKITTEGLINHPITRLIERRPHFDNAQTMTAQIRTLVDALGLTATEWQTDPLLILPPALNFAATILIAEIHGRCGYFPPIIRLRSIAASLPPRYEVAEVINLQTVRDQARERISQPQ